MTRSLGDQALYQSLRASLELTNSAGASNALAQILRLYPASDSNRHQLAARGRRFRGPEPAAGARAVFEKFEEQFPHSPLRPQVELAIARTYEQERNWPAAIGKYQGWLNDFPTNALRPQVDYALALANYQAGNETNAFGRFTNFVAQFPDHDLAPLAQWWVADHFFRLAGQISWRRKKIIKLFFKTPIGSDAGYTNLAYQARLMAGRAAMGRPSYTGRHPIISPALTSDTNCPPDLWTRRHCSPTAAR